jgi:hypothetical protein
VIQFSSKMKLAAAAFYAGRMTGGSVILYAGPMPKSPDEAPAATNRVLVGPVELLNPETLSGVGSDSSVATMVMLRAPSREASESGRATWARFVGRDGEVLFDADVGERDAAIVMDGGGVQLKRGEPFTLAHLRLMMA